jgi:hypothetical protein
MTFYRDEGSRRQKREAVSLLTTVVVRLCRAVRQLYLVIAKRLSPFLVPKIFWEM